MSGTSPQSSFSRSARPIAWRVSAYVPVFFGTDAFMIASRNCPDQQVEVSGQDSHIKASNFRLLKSEVDSPLRIVQYQPCVLANKWTKGVEHPQEYIPQALPL